MQHRSNAAPLRVPPRTPRHRRGIVVAVGWAALASFALALFFWAVALMLS